MIWVFGFQAGIVVNGLEVDEIIVGSVAYEAGVIEKGDRIIAINRTQINSEADLYLALARVGNNPSVSITVQKVPLPLLGMFTRTVDVTFPTAVLISSRLWGEAMSLNNIESSVQVPSLPVIQNPLTTSSSKSVATVPRRANEQKPCSMPETKYCKAHQYPESKRYGYKAKTERSGRGSYFHDYGYVLNRRIDAPT